MPLAVTRASVGPVTVPCVETIDTSIRVGSPSTYVGRIAISIRPFGSSVGTTIIDGAAVRCATGGPCGAQAAITSATRVALAGRHTDPRHSPPYPHKAEQRRGHQHDGATRRGVH